MADELKIRISADYFDPDTGAIESIDFAEFKVDVAGENKLHNIQSVGITEEALLIGDVTAGGYLFAINRDPSNNINLRQATAAANFATLKPGERQVFRFSTATTAPFAIADTAISKLEYWWFSL